MIQVRWTVTKSQKMKLFKNSKMDFKWNTVVDSFEGNERLTRVNLRNVKTNEIIPIDVDSASYYRYIPNTEIFKGILDMNKNGYMLTNENGTNIEGVLPLVMLEINSLSRLQQQLVMALLLVTQREKHLAESETFHNKSRAKTFRA